MPSHEARLLTRAHRRELARITALVTRRVHQITRTADPSDIDRWWQAQGSTLERIVARGAAASSATAARHLRSHALLEGRTVTPVPTVPDAEEIATGLRITGPVAFKTNIARTGALDAALRAMTSRLSGGATRLSLAGDRFTTINTWATSPTIVGYRRVADPDACAFCLMLVSRGAVYSEMGARQVVGAGGRPRGTRMIGESYHDSCRCSVEVLYEHEQEPARVRELRDRWEDSTAGLGGKDALNAFRRSLAA